MNKPKCTCLSNSEPKHHDSHCPVYLAYRKRRDAQNEDRRARHEAMTSLGLKRVRGALGGVYYE